MDVAFLSLRAKEPLAYGLMSLSAVLQRAGHRARLVVGRDVRELMADPWTARAEVLGMSTTTGLHRTYLRWARGLRRAYPDKAIVLGGPHPTFFPEVIESAPLDGVCVGEGEESFLEFLELWGEGLPRAPEGWWVRRGGRGEVLKGGLRPPVRDLDALPMPHYDLFYDIDRRHRRLPIRVFLATRGCPHRCTYCFNRNLNERYRGCGPVVRTRDPERLTDEILEVMARWGGRLVWFLDANLAGDRRWLGAFLPVYKRRVGLPFFCKLRPEKATARTVSMLVDAGCTGVGVGLESGSERLRREVLGRRASDAAILEGCRQLKAKGVRILAFNMLGIPGETLDDALRTVAMNAACQVDYGGATILQPYPGTELARRAIEEGLFDGDFESISNSYFAPSRLRLPGGVRHRDRLTNLQRVFSLAVEFPEIRSRLRWIIDRPPVPWLRHLFLGRHSWAMQQTFYRGFKRRPPEVVATEEQLLRACRELRIPDWPRS